MRFGYWCSFSLSCKGYVYLHSMSSSTLIPMQLKVSSRQLSNSSTMSTISKGSVTASKPRIVKHARHIYISIPTSPHVPIYGLISTLFTPSCPFILSLNPLEFRISSTFSITGPSRLRLQSPSSISYPARVALSSASYSQIFAFIPTPGT
jgi:hypothetical protein